jgi:hypothetical protein
MMLQGGGMDIRMAIPVVIVLIAASSTACGRLTDPDEDWHRRPGVIEIGGAQPAPLEVADTVATGTMSLTVRTWGSSTCTRADGARVELNDPEAIIRPYDLIATRRICTDDLASFPREVNVVWQRPGWWTIRVVGRNLQGDVAEFEHNVFVE